MSGYLTSRPSFLDGMARVFDIGGTMVRFNYSPSHKAADINAAISDRQAVKRDYRKAAEAMAADVSAETQE